MVSATASPLNPRRNEQHGLGTAVPALRSRAVCDPDLHPFLHARALTLPPKHQAQCVLLMVVMLGEVGWCLVHRAHAFPATINAAAASPLLSGHAGGLVLH